MKKNENKSLIFRPYITLKNGTRLYAKQYGKKAFCFLAKENADNKN